ncbi:hypothetical protein ACLOJK_009936 [Asimina triloba]
MNLPYMLHPQGPAKKSLLTIPRRWHSDQRPRSPTPNLSRKAQRPSPAGHACIYAAVKIDLLLSASQTRVRYQICSFVLTRGGSLKERGSYGVGTTPAPAPSHLRDTQHIPIVRTS